MMGHKICLFGEIRKIISELYLLLLLIWSSACYSLCLCHCAIAASTCFMLVCVKVNG